MQYPTHDTNSYKYLYSFFKSTKEVSALTPTVPSLTTCSTCKIPSSTCENFCFTCENLHFHQTLQLSYIFCVLHNGSGKAHILERGICFGIASGLFLHCLSIVLGLPLNCFGIPFGLSLFNVQRYGSGTRSRAANPK